VFLHQNNTYCVAENTVLYIVTLHFFFNCMCSFYRFYEVRKHCRNIDINVSNCDNADVRKFPSPVKLPLGRVVYP